MSADLGSLTQPPSAAVRQNLAVCCLATHTPDNQVVDDDALHAFAAEVVGAEADAVRAMEAVVREASFADAARRIRACRGAVVTTGVGKAGHVARKVSATLASVGTPSHFLSPGDALHGDLGSVRDDDLLLSFSASGETEELVRVQGVVRRMGLATLAICAGRESSLGRDADVVLAMGKVIEACPLKLAPSCSTTAMLALGDALALTVMRLRKFTASDFARYHPAGQLGRKLMRVDEAMTFRQGENLPLADASQTVGDVLREVSKIARRPGAILVTGGDGRLVGIFSDGDLRRLIVSDAAGALNRRVADVMTTSPKRIRHDALAADAMAIMRQYRVDELPAVDADDRPVGLIDVQDLVVLKLFDTDSPTS